MEILVCLKQVPDTEAEIRPTADNTDINYDGVKFVINVYDEYAVEEALKVKEKVGEGTITIVTLGPERAAESIYPQAVTCLLKDEEDLLTFSQINDPSQWSQIRTTNAIERRFREVRRRTKPMGGFSDHASMERILYAVFSYKNLQQGTSTPFLLLTQKC